MTRPSPQRVRLAVLTVVSLLAAACSALGLEQEGSATPATDAETGVEVEGGFTSDEDEEEETIEDLEAEWAAQRARVIDSLSGGSYGVGPDDILRGPGRLEVDLDDCPADWDDTAGLTDDAIKVGVVVAQSGQLSSFGLVAEGMQAYFDWVNENGGIDGRSIETVLRDDAYDAGVAQAAIDDLIEAENPFLVTSVGSPGSLAIYDDLNDECIPHPFVVSAHPAWGDPEVHPFTTGFQLSYSTEAIVWGAWIRANLASQVPVKVVALVADNDFGQVYADAFGRWAEENPDIVSEVVFVTHDPAKLEVTEEMEEVAEAAPQVFISMTNGRPCLSAVSEAARLGITQSVLAAFNPSVCRQPSAYMVPLGTAGDGFYVVGGGVKSAIDPALADDTFIEFVHTRLTDVGLDPNQSLVTIGFAQYGWAHVEALRLAAALPGGLSRTNLTLVMRNLDLQHPMLFEGVRFSTQGIRDGFVIEGAEVSRYDAEARAWFQQGPAVDLNGASPNCVWSELVCGR
ncbi:MAG: ABC transporter substrate-binding protein [Actinomycetota bacterium]